MAGYQENQNLWRLYTNTGIRYKYLGMTGGFSYDLANITATFIVHADDFENFVDFLFPPPIRYGFLEVPQYRPLPELPNLVATDLTFAPLDGIDLPIDPLEIDLTAPSGTYHKLIKVQVKYDTRPKAKDPDPTRPETFLEINASGTGEFLHTTARGAKWEVGSHPDIDTDGDGIGDKYESEFVTIGAHGPNTNELSGTYENPAGSGEYVRGKFTRIANQENRDPTVPITITVPTTEWTITWPRVNYEYFNEVLIHRIRASLGRVNYFPLAWLYNAEPETVLFAGWSREEKGSWRSSLTNKPPLSVEFKMIQKRIDWEGVVKGHNDVWRPGKGWQKLKLDDKQQDGTSEVGRSYYKTWDFDYLFKQ